MDLFDPTQIGLAAALRATAVRQSAISNNIANVNTPGYQRKDVDFAGRLDALMRAGDTKALDSFTPTANPDVSAPVRYDGSTVDADRENAEQAKNGLMYEALVGVMRGRIDILQAAMGTGN